jgi:predicted RNA binding protein YcfA (HicA-like mRNA interferase family)
MNRRTLLKHLKKHGCELFREGSKHSVYWNPASNETSTVPRHQEIKDRLAVKICKDLGIPNIKR